MAPRAARDWPVMLAILGLWAAMWALLQPLGGFPVNDDWAYSFAARSIVEQGRFALTGFSAPNLIAQAYWGALFCVPFGYSHEALQCSTFVAGAAGLCAVFGLMRELGADRRLAAGAMLTLGVNPLFLIDSASFMTDVPFAALCAGSFWLYVRGALRGQDWAIVAAYGLALVALFIRQFAMALPLAFAAATVMRRGFRVSALARAVLPVLLFAALHVAFQRWVVATGRAPGFAESVGSLAEASLSDRAPLFHRYGLAMLPYFGLFVLPFLALVLTRRDRGDRVGTRLWWASGVLGAALGLALIGRDYTLPGLQNGFSAYGLGPMTLRDQLILHANVPAAWGGPAFWMLLTVLGCVGTVGLGLFAARSVWRAVSVWAMDGRGTHWLEAMLLVFCAAYMGAVFAALMLDNIFDRYLISLVTPLCAYLFLVMPGRPGAPSRLAWAPLVACAVFAVAAGHDYFAFGRARWRAVTALEAEGVGAALIDGGFEYNASRLMRPEYRSKRGKSWWWVEDDQYVVGLGPLDGYETVSRVALPHWLVVTRYDLYVLRRVGSPPI